MGLIGKALLIISIIIVGILGYSGLYAYSLSKVKVIDVSINSLENVNPNGFTLGGDISVYNGGTLKADVSKIIYSVVLDKTGDQIASGLIEGRKIASKETANFSFSNRINWTPAADLALDIITGGNSNATLKGSAYVADLGFVELKAPFEKKIDLEAYIRQFVNSKIAEQAGNATTIEKIGEEIKTITGNIIKGIGNLFD
jgi:hypothetical protein